MNSFQPLHYVRNPIYTSSPPLSTDLIVIPVRNASHPQRPQLHLMYTSKRTPPLHHPLIPITTSHHKPHLLIPPPIPPSLPLPLIIKHSDIQRTTQYQTAPNNTQPPRRRVPEQFVEREREQHLCVNHVGCPTALFVLQPGCEEELHDEAADAEEDQVEPLAECGWEAEADAGDGEECDNADDGGPGGEVVYGNEGVGSFSDPPYRGVGASGA